MPANGIVAPNPETPSQEFKSLSERAMPVSQRVAAVSIRDADGYSDANELLVDIASMAKEVEAERVRLTGPLNVVLRRLNDSARALSEPLARARKILEEKMGAWRRAETERAEAEKRLADEARRRAEEAERQAALARQKAEDDRRAAESAKARAELDAMFASATPAALAKAESDRREADERAQRATEEQRTAATARDAAIVASMSVEKPLGHVFSGSGSSTPVERWDFEVTDESKLPREWLTPDLVKIGRAVRRKDGIRQIDGVRVFRVDGLAVKT